MKLGARDYLQKPFEVDELLALAPARVEQPARCSTEQQYLLSERDAEFNHYGIVGRSRAMQEVIAARRAGRRRPRARCSSPARPAPARSWSRARIHHRSAQRDMPLVKVNCAAIPETLLESELFGHVRGAFTGATMTKRGRFELADGGIDLPRRDRRR